MPANYSSLPAGDCQQAMHFYLVNYWCKSQSKNFVGKIFAREKPRWSTKLLQEKCSCE